MAHINPIKSKPLSPEGRENYDKIFRKLDAAKFYEKLDETLDDLSQAWEDKRRDKDRELYHELAQKHIDESA